MAHSGGKHNVRIAGIDHDATNATSLFQSHQGPGFAGIGRFVYSLTNGDVAADPSLTRARPNDVWIRWGYRKRTDRGNGLVVEDGFPVHAAVCGFEDSAGRCPNVIDIWFAGYSDH
jgi:hypothetical protein